MLEKEVYWLIQSPRIERHWRKVLRPEVELTPEYKETLANRFTHQLARKLIEEPRNVHSFEYWGAKIHDYPEYIEKYLKDGHIVLLNERGGFCFYYEGMEILKEVISDRFPGQEEKIGLIGFLDSNGEFHPCHYGEHRKHVERFVGDPNVVVFSSSEDQSTSSVFSDSKVLTKEQKEWFNQNQKLLDDTQFEQYEIIFKE